MIKFINFFNSCADISIASIDNNLLSTEPTTVQLNYLYLLSLLNPVDVLQIHTPSPFIVYPTQTRAITTTTTPIPLSFIFPMNPSKEIIDEKNKTFRCYATNPALKPLVGIENWCLQLCAINCPPTLCVCVKI